jgi:hypothetical protein
MSMNKITETNRTMKCAQRLLAEAKFEYRYINHQALVSPGKPPGLMCVCAYRRAHAHIRVFKGGGRSPGTGGINL